MVIDLFPRDWGTAIPITLLLSFATPAFAQTNEAGNLATAAQPVTEAERVTHAFSRSWLLERAQALSGQEFDLQVIDQNSRLNELGYDDYRRISFDPYAAIWARQDRNFTIDLFHPGFLYTTPVTINLVVGGISRRVLYNTDIFRYDDDIADVRNEDAQGYSGFRVYHPINVPDRFEEFLVFQGASYFRSTAKDQFYGLSARGLAINTARPQGEEFPYFTDFWIERPEVGADRIVVHALLNSPSVTGAYSFEINPGDSTVIDVEATLFPRQDLTHFGFAPLTSMFLFDPTNRSRFDDYRNSVHDSDGLQIMMNNGEQIWRPLANPQRLQVSSFQSSSPKGFGLMQRHRSFEDFNDSEARYDRRTSLWIEPQGDWGSGHVELVEIPTAQEVHDNIVAYWQPDAPLLADSSHTFQYRMHWGPAAPYEVNDGKIVDTRKGKAMDGDDVVFVIDYSNGRSIPGAATDPEAVEVRAETSAGTVVAANGVLVEATGNYRAYVRLNLAREDLAELRVTLHIDDEQWGETWIYRWTR
ncbi:MAG: glucan biosynthesis protein G [Pseudohongiella sp.]|nr:glucan biosynthesis protein G [Pseudohongiella sp.]MDO9521041.1 glucan biosynthesis protein G [Pseudohongiella sp.]MDP2128975.1 glucan biosynthesis protein G [Pseudohongiella sp.]